MARLATRANPEIIKWAREESGYSLKEAATKIGVGSGQLEWWEEGAGSPSIAQLRKISTTYKRPLATFYLAEVPRGFRVTTDFRRLPGEVADHYSPELRLELRVATYYRDVALRLAAGAGESVPRFDLTVSSDADIENTGKRVRDYFAIRDRRGWDSREVFAHWRRAIELRGVLVFQLVRVPTAEMRGFSLAASQLPIIAVNRKDAYAGRVFSLVHEVVHLALHSAGLCDVTDFGQRPPDKQSLETFCNRVAGAALVPANALLSHRLVVHHAAKEWHDVELHGLSRAFGVSKEAILRRLLTLGRTTEAFYKDARKNFEEEYERLRASEPRATDDFARNMAQETIGMLGRSYVSLVLESYQQDKITLSDVSSYLGVRIKHVPRIEEIMRVS